MQRLLLKGEVFKEHEGHQCSEGRLNQKNHRAEFREARKERSADTEHVPAVLKIQGTQPGSLFKIQIPKPTHRGSHLEDPEQSLGI